MLERRLVGWWLAMTVVAVAPRARAQSTASFPSDAVAPTAPRPPAPSAPPTPPPAPVAPPRAPVALPPAAPPVRSKAAPPPAAAPSAAPRPAPTPVAVPLAASSDTRPPVLPYYQGMPVPPGYQVVNRPASGIITGGLVGLGVSYGGALIVAAAQGFGNATGWLALPVAGPWLAIAERNYEQCKTTTVQQARRCITGAVGEVQFITFVAVDGVFQIASGLLIVAGLVSSRDELIRQDLVHVTVAPSRSGGADFAVTVQGRF